MFRNPQVIGITAAIVGYPGTDPGDAESGLPAAGRRRSAALAWNMAAHQAKRWPRPRLPVAPPPVSREPLEASWNDVAPVDVLGLEVGYRLIPLVNKRRTANCCAVSAAYARNSPRRSASWCRRCISATTSS